MEPAKENKKSLLEEIVPESSTNVGMNVRKYIEECNNQKQFLDCLILAIIHKVNTKGLFDNRLVWEKAGKNILDNNNSIFSIGVQ